MTTASPARIMEVGMAFWPAKVLLSAIELRLFSELGSTSKTMLIEFGDAFDFTVADFFGWCREAGFRRTEVIPLAGSASAGVAYK